MAVDLSRERRRSCGSGAAFIALSCPASGNMPSLINVTKPCEAVGLALAARFDLAGGLFYERPSWLFQGNGEESRKRRTLPGRLLLDTP